MSRDLFALREAPTAIENIGGNRGEKRESLGVIDELPETFIR